MGSGRPFDQLLLQGLAGVGFRMRSRTSVATSGRDEMTWSKRVFSAVIRLVVKCASTWANQSSGSEGQNGGSLTVWTTAMVGGASPPAASPGARSLLMLNE